MLSELNWKIVGALALTVILIALYSKLFAIIALLAVVVFVSLIIQQIPPPRVFGIELVMFATVVSGMAYGSFVGTMLGMLLVLIYLAFSGYLRVYFLWVVPMYVVAGFLAGQWTGDIVSTGINILLVVHGANLVFTFLLNRGNIFNYVLYIATNIVFNFIVFSLFGAAAIGFLE